MDYNNVDQLIANANASVDQMGLGLGTIPPINKLSNIDLTNVQDADTIDGKRLAGFDALESYTGSDKAKKIEDLYGVSANMQSQVGQEGKVKLLELLKEPEYNQFARQSVGFHGRDVISNDALADEMIRTGNAVPYSKSDQKRQELYRRQAEKEFKLNGTTERSDALAGQRQYNLDQDSASYASRVGESIDALQSGAVQAVGSLGDFVTDIGAFGAEQIGADEVATRLDNMFGTMKTPEFADKLVGYDRTEATFAMQEATHQWDIGNYGTALGIALTTPEVVAESLPLMAEMMIGMGGKVKVAKGVYESLPGLANALKRNVGLAAVIGQESNSDIEEFTKNNNGEEPTAGKVAQIVGTNALMFSLDRLAFKDLLNAKDGLVAMAKNVAEDAVPALALKAIGVATKIAKGGATEGAQEYIQTWGEILNVNLGADGKTLEEIWNDPELRREAQAGGIMGAGAGSQISIVGSAADLVNVAGEATRKKRTAEELKAQAKEGMDKRASELDAEAEVTAEPVVEPTEEEVVAEKEAKTEETLATYTEALKAQGLDEETVTAQTEVMRKKLSDLGIDETLTAEDRSAGLSVESTDVEGIDVKAKGSKKSKTADAINMSDDVMTTILEGKFTKQTMEDIIDTKQNTKDTERNAEHLTQGTATQETIVEVANSINDTLATENGMKSLEGLVSEDTPNKSEKVLRMVSLAMSALKGAVTAEDDLHSKAGIDNPTNGGARTLGLNIQLGKDYMNSYGLTYAGDAELTNSKYAEMGDKILNFASEAGLVELDFAKVVAPQVVDIKGKGFFGEEGFAQGTGMEGVGTAFDTTEKKVTTVELPIARLKDNTGTGRDVNSTKGYAMSVLARLLKPINYELPTLDPVEAVPVQRALNPKHEAIIKEYNKLKYSIKPEFVALLREIKDRIYGEDGLKDYDKMTRQDQMLIDVLDLNSTNAALNKRGEEGRSLNRKDNLRKVLDNLEMFENNADVYFNYESAINQRIHVMQTILDYQGDKFMARQMMSGGEYTTQTGNEAILLIEAVADELNMPTDTILNPSKDPVLKKAVELLTKGKGTMNLRSLVQLATRANIGNPFQALSLFKAVYEISLAEDTSKITSSYMVEQDATASGVVNTLLNLAGNPKVQAVLARMGIAPGMDSKDGLDPYNLLNKVVEEVNEADFDDVIKPELDSLKAMGIKLRDIAKSPVMTWFYGQSNPNTENSMANSLAIDVANAAIQDGNTVALKKLNKVLGTSYTKSSVKGITEKDLTKLEAHYKETVAKYYVSTLEVAFPGVIAYRNKMGKVYDLLESTGEWDGTIKSAMDAMLPGKDTKMSVQKDKTTVSRLDAGKPWILVNQMMNNKTSFNVNLQHSSDAALLLLSLKDAIIEFGLDNGIMSVHDAAYSNPAIGIFVKQRYEKYTAELAGKYDYLDVAFAEAQTAINKMPKIGGKMSQKAQNAQAKLDALKVDHAKTMSSKKEFLSNLETNIFGNKNVTDNETPVEIATEPTVEPEPEVVVEAEPGFITVVFNESGKAYDYQVDNMADYKKGQAINVFNTTATVKNVVAEADHKPVEGIEYKNINKITKEDVYTKSFSELMTSAIKDMRKKNANVKEIMSTLLDTIVVSKSHKELLQKVTDALADKEITLFSSKDGFSGNVDVIGVGHDVIDARTKRVFTEDGLVETLAHEVDHAYQVGYIQENMNSTEVKYLQRVLAKFGTDAFTSKLGVDARARVNYIMNQNKAKIKAAENRLLGMKFSKKADVIAKLEEEIATLKSETSVRQMAEMVAVLRNEGDVSEEIMRALGTGSKFRTVIASIIDKINSWIKGLSPAARKKYMEGEVDYLATRIALETLNDKALVANAEARLTGKTPKKEDYYMADAQYKRYKEVYDNPFEYVNQASINSNALMASWMGNFGEIVYSMTYPLIRKGHVTAKKKWDLYEGTANLVHYGLFEADLSQRLRKSIGINNDSRDMLLHKLLGIGTDMMQKSQELLTNNMADLDKQIKKAYPEKADQVRLYKLFAKTGIANLQHSPEMAKSILDGSMSIDSALKEVSKGLDVADKAQLDAIAEYMVTGKSTTGDINADAVSVHRKEVELYVTLKALSKINGAQEMFANMNSDLGQHLYVRSLDIYALNKEIHKNALSPDGEVLESGVAYTTDYDGQYTMDVHENVHEYKMVTEMELRTDKYSEKADWVVVREPNKAEGIVGIVARPVIDAANTPGVGLDVNKFNNGFYLDKEQSIAITNRLSKMTEKEAHTYMVANSLVRTGNRFRFTLDEKTKVEVLGMKQNIADSLYRTYVHQKELIESQTVRDMILDEGTDIMSDEDDLKAFNDLVSSNRNAKPTDKVQLPPFVHIDYDYGSYDSLPKHIKTYYKTPSNLSTFNGFNRKVTLVKRGDADVLLGHKNYKLFGDDQRALAKTEYTFKKLVVLAKMHMVVTAPAKLAVDFVSNIGILSALDVPITSIPGSFKKGWKGYSEISKLRGEQVQLELDVRAGVDGSKKKLDAKKREIENSDFYDAYKNGFIQSYSTDLTLKEFDTISGLQKNIDDLVDGITYDKKGNPNEAHKAIKAWMRFGGDSFNVESLFAAASKLSVLNGTAISAEMLKLSERLKSKKDSESVARYVSDLIGSPSSEVVAVGGATMVITDALSKYTLAKHLMGTVNPKTNEIYTKDQAYLEANMAFIDYRQNLPAEVKALSDLGVLMFPAFWMKIQKVIIGLIRYHPATAIGGYTLAQVLDMNSANIIDTNLFNKIIDGTVVNDPTSIIDLNTFSWITKAFD